MESIAEPIAVVSDVHGNLEALVAILNDIRQQGVRRVAFLGDLINYGANTAEVLDIVIEMCLPENERKINRFKSKPYGVDLTGFVVEDIIGGNHEGDAKNYIQGMDIQGQTHEGPHEAMRIMCTKLFTQDPQRYVLPSTRDSILLKERISVPADLSDVLERLGKGFAEKVKDNFPGLGTRFSREKMAEWIKGELEKYLSTYGASIFANRQPSMPARDSAIEKEVAEYDLATKRYELIKAMASKSKASIKDPKLHCFHSSWENQSVYTYDPFQREVLGDERLPDHYTPAENVSSLARRIGKKEKLVIVHGHTHLASIFEDEGIVVDVGASIPRAREYVIKGYRGNDQKYTFENATYAIFGQDCPRIRCVGYDWESTYSKMKDEYDWKNRTEHQKKAMKPLMKIWAIEKGDWIAGKAS